MKNPRMTVPLDVLSFIFPLFFPIILESSCFLLRPHYSGDGNTPAPTGAAASGLRCSFQNQNPCLVQMWIVSSLHPPAFPFLTHCLWPVQSAAGANMLPLLHLHQLPA